MAKKQVSTLLHSHHPLALLFPLQKEHVHTWGLKRRSRSGEKAMLFFGSSFSPEKRMCASLYTSNMATHMCRHGDGKRNEKAEEKWLFSFYSSFSSAKRYVHLYTHLLIRNICAYMGNEKQTKKWRKGRYLHSYVATCLWFFSFLCNKKCAYLSAHEMGRRPRKSG